MFALLAFLTTFKANVRFKMNLCDKLEKTSKSMENSLVGADRISDYFQDESLPLTPSCQAANRKS